MSALTRDKPRLILAASDRCPDALYATKFFAPDPFIFLEQAGKSTLLLSDLEIDRGRREAKVTEVLPSESFAASLRKRLHGEPNLAQIAASLLKSRRIRRVSVPSSFPLGYARELERCGIGVEPLPGLFWGAREEKNTAELGAISNALRMTEAGLTRGMEVLRASRKGDGGQLRWAGGVLTSERLRAEIDSAVLRYGGIPGGTIVAGGIQACDPHERGHGPLRAGELIILDVFPRDARTGYFGDMTRTVVRGRATPEQRQLWETVRAAQKLVLEGMRPGADGGALHAAVKDFFTARGYETKQQGKQGRWVGFFHGTGHGLGLELHEEPRFSRTIFRAGQVLTVEPGLYYPGIGGVRIEDVGVLIRKGVRVLSDFPTFLEV